MSVDNLKILRKKITYVDVLCEFFEVAVHQILYVRKLYPKGAFKKSSKYQCIVYQCIHPELIEYIRECLKAIEYHSKRKELDKLFVCIVNGNKVLERFVFDVLNLSDQFEKSDKLGLILQQSLRTFCLKLHNRFDDLGELPDEASFSIQLLTSLKSSLSFNEDPTYKNFPWMGVNLSEGDIKTGEIIPVHTIETDSVALQIYIEKSLK